jgi:hypothetical protein
LKQALDDLWRYRRRGIVQHVYGKPPGRQKKLDVERRDALADEVLDVAYYIFLDSPTTRKSFKNMYARRRIELSGWVDTKIEKARNRIDDEGWRGYVYSFWRGDECSYVGRTDGGSRRFAQNDERERFRRSGRLTILLPWHLADLDRLECLAVHYFEPTENEYMPSLRRYKRKCPICSQLQKISRDLNRLFRLR